MKFSDYLRLAFRNIRRQKLRSALTIFAVVIGATSVTIMLALVTGAKGFFLQQVESSGLLEQVAVSPKSDITDFNDANNGGQCDSCTKLTDAIVTKIKTIPHVIGVARVVNDGAIQAISLGSKKLTAERTTAYDANGIIESNVVAGNDLTPGDDNTIKDMVVPITISSDYADKFGFKGNYGGIINQSVTLETRSYYTGIGADVQKPQQCNGPCDNNNQQQQKPTELKGKIVGVINSDNQSKSIRIPLAWIRAMDQSRRYDQTAADRKAQQNACNNVRGPCNSTPNYTLISQDMLAANGYGSLIAKVDNSKNAAEVATQIKKLGVGAADAEASIKQQLTVFNIMGLILGGIGGISLAVAAVGVVNTMIMAILERTREIGVMRAVGAKRSTVRGLFTFEASMLGFWGGVIGVAVGFGLTRIANVFVNKQLASQGVKAHNIIGLPVWLILAVIGVGTLIGMLAGLYPASRAAKLDPVEALHYE
ncbi:MAG TPA: ABC transporter permease [Candidatus Saccharimonadales bacterium]|nr:ABC transporter permease [Candidatus Saccharimonadales bacterium]